MAVKKVADKKKYLNKGVNVVKAKEKAKEHITHNLLTRKIKINKTK